MHPCPAPKCRGWDGNATLTDTPMCPHHTTKVSEALTDLPRLYAQLTGALGNIGAGDDSGKRHTKSPAAPLPINPQARALQEDMLNVTRAADHTYRDAKSFSPPAPRHPHHPHGRELITLRERCTFLATHIDGVLDLHVTWGVELLKIRFASQQLLGLTRLTHRLHAPCPECDCLALVREDGSSYVQCRACRVAFDESRYGLLTRILASEAPTSHPADPRPHLAARSEGSGW